MVCCWDIFTLIDFHGFNFDATYRTSTNTLTAPYTIINIHVQTGTDDIVIIVIEANIPFWSGPFFYWVLKRHDSFSSPDKVTNGYSHPCQKGCNGKPDI